MSKSLAITIGILSLWSCHNKTTDLPQIEHVVVIGFDGLSPDGIQKSNTPTFDRMIAEGASSMNARAVLPTSSSSNWASMIMGAGPAQHGITSNDWERDNFTLPTVVQEDDFLFPSIFSLINNQKESAEIGAIYHWKGFGRLFEKKAVDYHINTKTEDETAQVAVNYIKEKTPNFTFIHFDHVDHAGHTYGHGTDHYYESVEKADMLLKKVITAIENSALAGKTLVIISSDHGGIGKGHGGESLEEVEIPFITWGPNVKKGYQIQLPIYQYDNAATVAYAMGITIPHAWIGKPVKTIFNGIEIKDAYPIIQSSPKKPAVLPEASLDTPTDSLLKDSTTVKINPS